MTRPSLAPQIAARIIDHIRAERLPRGHHLTSQSLADAFRVSRAPVTGALRKLETMGVVRSEPNRGYFLLKSGAELGKRAGAALNEAEPEDTVYFALAADRLAGKLPDRFSEAELMRLYALTRGRLLKLLHRVAEEGWIERLPGNGWAFLPTLTSRDAYEQGYQFRAAIESQALLSPAFAIDARGFAAARAEQQAIIDGGAKRMTRDHLFRANTQFHEMLAACSGNEFFSDALKRVNRLRRLAEYKITIDRSRLPEQCAQHLKILDLIESGKQQEASNFMRVHILGAGVLKSPLVG